MKYKFDRKQLETIHMVMEFNGEWGPRAAYRYFHKLPESASIETEDVEEFTIDFMNQYNAEFRQTY